MQIQTDFGEVARQGRAIRAVKELCQEYLPAFQGDSGSAAAHERRAALVQGLLAPILAFKDTKGGWAAERLCILWNRNKRTRCRICQKPITWNNVTVDHMKAWSRGWPTGLKNTQIAHHRCSNRKGAR
jgi:hypothetical protein